MISYKHKCVFVHIPKTGGTSIEKLLFNSSQRILRPKNKKEIKKVHKHLYGYDQATNNWLQHLTLDEINLKLLDRNDSIGNYFSFAFVRNPWDRVISEWVWRGSTRKRKFNIDNLHRFFLRVEGNALEHSHFRPQIDFILSGSNYADFIGRFENLQKDFNTVCDKIGMKRRKLPHTNTTKHKHYTKYYDDETREIVAEKYKKDIEYFGYEFGE